MRIRALIVDDEPLARQGLRNLLAGEADIELVGESPDGLRALEDIRDRAPDVVFLDVQMPGMDGLEVVASMDAAARPLIVFVTAYDLYAMRAFQAHAVDYLLKPLDRARFADSLARIRTLLRGRERGDVDDRIGALLASLDRSSYLERVLVKSAGRLDVVRVSEIDWIHADGDYAELHGPGATHLLRETLQSLEKRLDPKEFVRIHRSYLVRLDRIRRVEWLENGDGTVSLDGEAKLPVSRTHRESLLRALTSAD